MKIGIIAAGLFLFSSLLFRAGADDSKLPADKFPPTQVPIFGGPDWDYPTFIMTLHEKSLLDYPDNVDVYRLIVCGAFRPGPMVIIIRNGDKMAVRMVQPMSSNGFYISVVTMDKTRDLKSEEWKTFDALMQKSDFWQAKPFVDRLLGMDGATFFLEARVKGKYHDVVRWMPEDYPEDKSFADLCDWMCDTIDTKEGDVITKPYRSK